MTNIYKDEPDEDESGKLLFKVEEKKEFGHTRFLSEPKSYHFSSDYTVTALVW